MSSFHSFHGPKLTHTFILPLQPYSFFIPSQHHKLITEKLHEYDLLQAWGILDNSTKLKKFQNHLDGSWPVQHPAEFDACTARLIWGQLAPSSQPENHPPETFFSGLWRHVFFSRCADAKYALASWFHCGQDSRWGYREYISLPWPAGLAVGYLLRGTWTCQPRLHNIELLVSS